ncbi:uncharacterized protein ACR2FA_004954 [Aphomia sociella]
MDDDEVPMQMTRYEKYLLQFSVVRADIANETDAEIIFPPECDGKDICNVKPKNYPDHKFHSLVKDLDLKRIRRSPQYFEDVQGNIDDEYADQNCRAEYEIIMPFGVKDDNILKPVVQLPYFQQKIRTVRCADEKAECMKEVLNDYSYNTSCTTKEGIIKAILKKNIHF